MSGESKKKGEGRMKKFFRTIFTVCLMAISFIIGSIVSGDGLGIGKGLGILKTSESGKQGDNTPAGGVQVVVDPNDGSVTTVYGDDEEPVNTDPQEEQTEAPDVDDMVYVYTDVNEISIMFETMGIENQSYDALNKDEINKFEKDIKEIYGKYPNVKFIWVCMDGTSAYLYTEFNESITRLKNNDGINIMSLDDMDVVG